MNEQKVGVGVSTALWMSHCGDEMAGSAGFTLQGGLAVLRAVGVSRPSKSKRVGNAGRPSPLYIAKGSSGMGNHGCVGWERLGE